ncbi:unnamed protein product [Clavelina lepadiformis]|uniref:PDZ domain-containing protein n=1 Tax=Clavelina lepadiformis TaxID=159417 RepID=A0ABP0FM14_CLALP
MGAQPETEVVCQSLVEKKVDKRRFPIGPIWKKKHCALNSEAIRLYRSKVKFSAGDRPLRTIPLCHIKNVKRLEDERDTNMNYFTIFTEQGEVLTFRTKSDVGWVAQIQIQLIHYKNRQDILRYKQLNQSMAVAESALQRLCCNAPNNNDVTEEVCRRKMTSKEYRSVTLPNHRSSGIGIGLTVIPLQDGRVVVNRVLEGGPAMRLGIIQPRDQIISANGIRVTSVEMLSHVVKNSPESVTLMVKPRIAKVSPDLDDPKMLLKEVESGSPEYINTHSESDVKQRFEKGLLKQTARRKESPRHFKFT